MAPREGCPLCSAGDWCSRLSWPGAPVTSFRWGRVVTINVSPGGATSSARRDAPRRSSGIPCVRTAAPGFRRRRTLPSLCHSLRTVRRAGARRERTSSLSCKASCGQPIPKSVAATPPVIPCVRTAEPWIRRRRTLPSSCHSLRADNRARASSRTHLAVVLQGLVRATDPKVRRGHASVAPCVRTAAPWIRRRRTPPSSCHSLRADNRARASSRTHLRPRARPPRVQTARLRLHPRAPGTLIQQAVTYDGDIPRGRVRVTPGGGIRRRRGQQSRPPTRRMPPATQKCPHTRRMSPAATPECGASTASRATGAASVPAPTSNHDLRAPHRRQKRPDRARLSQLQGRGGSQPWGKSARPRRPDPGGVDPAGRPVSTALTSTSPPSKTSPRIVGILRFLHSARRRCWVDVSTMDTGDPPDLFPRPTLASETTDHL